jgi:DNA-binding transcriptional regulator YiaG
MDAAQIKAIRAARQETQDEFAKHFGVVRSTVAMWEANGTPDTGAGRHHVERILSELTNDADARA